MTNVNHSNTMSGDITLTSELPIAGTCKNRTGNNLVGVAKVKIQQTATGGAKRTKASLKRKAGK